MITQDLGKAGVTSNGVWDITSTYEKNSIVFNMYDNTSYISRQDVSAGIEITNDSYWQPFAGLSIDDGSISVDKLAPDVKDLIYASFPVDTASGSIASFEDGADNVPVRELKLNLEPYQNLNGYDHPWVGGAGKNLFNADGLTQYSSNGITATVSNGTITLNGTATANAFFPMRNTGYPSGTYTWSFNNSAVNDGVRISFRNTGGTYWAEYRADAVNKTCTVTGEPDNLLFYVYSGTTVTNFTVKPQFEKGSTATAWTPYENICPITGHTETNVVRTGKNLVPLDGWVQGQLTGDGLPNSAAYAVSSPFILLKGGETYLLSRNYPNYGNGQMAYHTYALDKTTHISDSGWVANDRSISPSNDCYIRLTTRAKAHNANPPNLSPSDVGTMFTVQLEVGSTATPYEPYVGNTYSIPFGQTVYGGTLEVETGLLTVTKNLVVFDGTQASSNFSYATSEDATHGRIAWVPYQTVGKIGGNAFLSDKMKASSIYTSEPNIWEVSNSGASVARCFIGVPTTITSVADWQTYVTSNPIQLVYELATPVQYQLTPTQVSTLLGYNNIWTDSGTVEVQYLANIGLYIQKIIGATEDDMVANQNISANKYFFVGEELYYSTSAISAGQTIVVGTNCIKTNLADALNALNS